MLTSSMQSGHNVQYSDKRHTVEVQTTYLAVLAVFYQAITLVLVILGKLLALFWFYISNTKINLLPFFAVPIITFFMATGLRAF